MTDHDRGVLGNELTDFCAQYRIYHVREAQESLEVTGIRTEGEVIRRHPDIHVCVQNALTRGSHFYTATDKSLQTEVVKPFFAWIKAW